MAEKATVKFRVPDLKNWQLAIPVTRELFDLADEIEKRRLYRFAEQLRAAGISISNHIAEGSGSSSPREFKHFLNRARRPAFENANILILLQRRDLLSRKALDKFLDERDHLCRQITNSQKSWT